MRVGRGSSPATKSRFHTRWIPSDIKSFIRSYRGATLSNTARTMGFFSAVGTVRKPKSVSGLLLMRPAYSLSRSDAGTP